MLDINLIREKPDLVKSAMRDLNADAPIDWDDTPTIHLSTEIAFGHLVRYKEVWRADGYSLGDLLYSLPLAPNQRRRVAVVDWERRTTAARAETLEFEESLDAVIQRDRDVQEIVGTDLHESTSGGSRNTTYGFSAGIGGGFLSGAFGIFGGVSGGVSGSTTPSSQYLLPEVKLHTPTVPAVSRMALSVYSFHCMIRPMASGWKLRISCSRRDTCSRGG